MEGSEPAGDEPEAAFKFGHSLSDRDLPLLHEGDVINRVMAEGRHPGIVALEDVWADGDELPWLRFEFVAGGDLTGLIHGWQKLPAEERLRRAVAALQGLAETVGYFHRLNPAIVHRDLKPSNILVDPSTGKLKVADFGIGAVSARRLLDGELNGSVSRGGRLQSYLRGSHTPLYASPQQRAGSRLLDPRDDVHALGVMAYQMVTGYLDRAPGRGFERVMKAAGAFEEFIRLIGDCVEEDPQYRPKDALVLAESWWALDWELVNNPPSAKPVTEAAAPTKTAPRTQGTGAQPPTPAAVAMKRQNVIMPILPPGLMQSQLVPIKTSTHSGYVAITGWAGPNGAIVGGGAPIAAARDQHGSEFQIHAPATGVITEQCACEDSYSYSHGPGTTVASISVIGMAEDDWSSGKSGQPPKPTVTFARSGDGVVYPGDHAWVHVTVENTGRGDLVQAWAQVRSTNPILARWQTTLGRIKPGEKVERCLAAVLPLDTPPGEIRGELVFHEGNGFPIPTRPLVFTVRPLPRPDFATRWTIVNDGSGASHGNGDGKPKRGEYVDLAVTVENQTGEDFEWLFLTLHPKKLPPGTRITAPRGDLGPVKDGTTAEGRVSFAVDPGGQPGPAAFELRVESTDGRTFAVETVEVTIG